MKKALYLLCVLVITACSKKDNDYIALTDYEKPFSSASSVELKQIVQTNMDLCKQLLDEFYDLTSNEMLPIYNAMDHYGVNPDSFNGIVNFSESATRTSHATAFIGMTYTWNPNKTTPGFDKTVGTNGAMIEYYFPSSVEDDSKNDIHVIINLQITTGSYQQEISFYKDGTLKAKGSRFRTNDEYRQSMEIAPYTYSAKLDGMEKPFRPTIISETSRQYQIEKEGGSSYFLSMQMVGSNMETTIDYNNIRVRATINQYPIISQLINSMMEDINSENYNELSLELINKNMRPAVLVFSDRNEKIGDISMTTGQLPFAKAWVCHFLDGEQIQLPIMPVKLLE